jgi:hypothetical protein
MADPASPKSVWGDLLTIVGASILFGIFSTLIMYGVGVSVVYLFFVPVILVLAGAIVKRW